MRVLYLLTDGFGGQGGIAQFNRDLLRAICSHPDVSEVVAFPRYVSDQTGELPAKLAYDARYAHGKLRYVTGIFAWLLKSRSVELIICTHLHLQWLAALAHRIKRAPSLLVLHGVEAWTPAKTALRRAAARNADWVAAVSRFTLTRFSEWAPLSKDRTLILPCCVDLARFTPGSPSKAVSDKYKLRDAVVILSLGRIAKGERYKGFDELLDNLSELRRQEPNVLCVVAGDGDDRARLMAKALELGLSEAVRFTGFVPDDERVDLYRSARAFVLAGRGEGFGIVLLEAMACGIPVIASKLDGSFEAVRGGELGQVVDPRDGAALVAAIREAVHRPVGIRPAGLQDFGYQAFEGRVHKLIGDMTRRVCGQYAGSAAEDVPAQTR
jgi:phosphatidylinositol alpha-1,6-mannosyltransferase